MSERDHIFENAIHLDEYTKDFKVLSKPTSKGVEIHVSYKDNIKKLGLVTLEDTELDRDKQAYFFIIGKGYSDEGFCFTKQPENFEAQTFEESLFNQEVDPNTKTIKMLITSASDFVELGDALLHAIFDRFTSDEVYYNYIYKNWKKK